MHAAEHDDAVANRAMGRYRRLDTLAGSACQGLARGRPHQQLSTRRAHYITENGASLNGRQLLGIANEDEVCVGTNGFHQPSHQRERHHGRLVDHDHVVCETVQAIMAEAAAVAGVEAEETMQRGPLQLQEAGPLVGIDWQHPSFLVHGLFKSLGSLSRRRGQGDQRQAPASRGLFIQQGQDPSHCRGLARAGPAGDDREAPQDCGRGREPLKVRLVLAGEESLQPRREQFDVDACCGGLGERKKVSGDLLLLRPEPIEIQRRSLESQRAIGSNTWAVAEPGDPVTFLRPRKRLQIDWHVEVRARRRADRGEIHAHVA